MKATIDAITLTIKLLDAVLEQLIIVVAIDGISEQVYKQYRTNGDF